MGRTEILRQVVGSVILINRANDPNEIRTLLQKFLSEAIIQEAETTPGLWGCHPGYFGGHLDQEMPIEGTPYFIRLHEAPWDYSKWSYLAIGLVGTSIRLNEGPEIPLVSLEMPSGEILSKFDQFVADQGLPAVGIHSFRYEPISEEEKDLGAATNWL